MYKNEGLEAPESVKTATSSYRQETDTVGLFIKEDTVKNVKAEARKTSEAYKFYTRWCNDSNLKAVELKGFVGIMRNAGLVKRDGKLGNVVYGVDIKPVE